jgi:hypothetical protein
MRSHPAIFLRSLTRVKQSPLVTHLFYLCINFCESVVVPLADSRKTSPEFASLLNLLCWQVVERTVNWHHLTQSLVDWRVISICWRRRLFRPGLIAGAVWALSPYVAASGFRGFGLSGSGRFHSNESRFNNPRLWGVKWVLSAEWRSRSVRYVRSRTSRAVVTRQGQAVGRRRPLRDSPARAFTQSLSSHGRSGDVRIKPRQGAHI